jgi:hypothetical protein
MSEDFEELRATLFCHSSDLFDSLQVTSTSSLANDIFDKELNDLRRETAGTWLVTTTRRSITISGYDYRAYHAGGFDVDAHDAASVTFIESGTINHLMRCSQPINAGSHGRGPFDILVPKESSDSSRQPHHSTLRKKLKDRNVFGASSDECLALRYRTVRSGDPWRRIVASMAKQIEAAAIKRMAKATSAPAGVHRDTRLEKSG